jgi:hypothetical protein
MRGKRARIECVRQSLPGQTEFHPSSDLAALGHLLPQGEKE